MSLQYGKLFQPFPLTTSDSVIYSVPAAPASGLLRSARIRITNTTNASVTVTLNAVPAAGAVATSNQFLAGSSIGPNGYQDIDLPTLEAGGSLHGLASATGIVVHYLNGVLYAP